MPTLFLSYSILFIDADCGELVNCGSSCGDTWILVGHRPLHSGTPVTATSPPPDPSAPYGGTSTRGCVDLEWLGHGKRFLTLGP